MAGNTATSEWARIREGANEVEKLIGQKQYNLAMIKSRQTLEYMVRGLCIRTGIEGEDLSDTIDKLYMNHVISKTTAEHYHKIRLIGNKAAHEGDENANGANTAYHLLSQELYTFATDFSPRTTVREIAEKDDSRPRQNRRTVPVNKPPQGRGFSPELLFKIMIPVLAILLIVAVVRLIVPKKQKVNTEERPEMQIASIETTPFVPETTTEPETTASPYVWKTTDSLRIRTAPGTDAEIITVVPAGTPLQYVSDVDDTWAKIIFDGVEAYVSKEYLVAEETSAAPVPADEIPPEGAPQEVPQEGEAQ